MTNLRVDYNHYEKEGEEVPTIVVNGLRLRGDECGHFYAWLKEQGMNRRGDIVLIALTRAIDGQQGSIGGSRDSRTSLDQAREHTARKIADRYGEEVEFF
jgi:hypothetical protein